MAKVRKKGTRVFYADAATAWVALAAAANPSASFTQITDINDVDVVPFVPEKFDDSNLEDSTRDMVVDQAPGSATFTKDVNAESVTLDGFAQAGTKKAIAILYADGTAWYCGSCYLIPTSAGKAEKQDFKNAATESYTLECVSGKFDLQAAA